jgi:hypothetical protein
MVQTKPRRIRIVKSVRAWTPIEDLTLYDVMEHVRKTAATPAQGYKKVAKMTGRSKGAAYQRWKILSHQVTSGVFEPEVVRATLNKEETPAAPKVITPPAPISEVFNPQDINEAALEDLVKRLILGAKKAEARDTVAPRIKVLAKELLDLISQL